MSSDDHELLAAIEAQIAREKGARARMRALPTRSRLLLAALVAAMVLVLVTLLARRIDFGYYPVLRMAIELAVLGGLVTWAGLLALRPLHRPPLSGWVIPTCIAAAVLSAAVLALLPPAHMEHPASLSGVGDDLVRRAAACFVFGCLLAAPLAVTLALANRLSAPSVTAFVCAGLLGVAGLELHCPLVASRHLLPGHATVVFATALVGIILRWLFDWRCSARKSAISR